MVQLKDVIGKKSGYYLYCDYSNDYFEWKKAGEGNTDSLKGLNKLNFTAIEAIRINYLVHKGCGAEQIYDLLDFHYGKSVTKNQLKMFILAIRNNKLSYWLKMNKKYQYKELVELYEVET